MSAKPNWSPLSHQVHRALKGAGLRRVGVAVSGGRDSVLLLTVLQEIRAALDLEVHVLHVHHGVAIHDPAQQNFRAQAMQFTVDLARQFGVPIHVIESAEALLSEEAQRDFRRQFFERIAREQNLQAVFLGHHGQDLLETRLQRLIRGTGGQGLPGMLEVSEVYRRPFLHCDFSQIETEARLRELSFLRDPSNVDSQYFRNWLRGEWLPQLEAKAPGSVHRLGESLELLVQEIRSSREQFPPKGLFMTSQVLAHPVYQQLSSGDQLRSLAHLIRGIRSSKGELNYSRGQLLEIQKRLDNSQNEHTFTVAGVCFIVNVATIEVHSSL